MSNGQYYLERIPLSQNIEYRVHKWLEFNSTDIRFMNPPQYVVDTFHFNIGDQKRYVLEDFLLLVVVSKANAIKYL